MGAYSPPGIYLAHPLNQIKIESNRTWSPFAADCAAARSAGQLDDVQGILGDQCGLPQTRVRHKREVRASRSGEEGKKSDGES